MKTLANRRRSSLTEDALQSIRSRIVNGELELGSALSEIALAESLGVSKTPVREALMQLKREGLVKVYPQRGTFVFEIDAKTVRDICDFRRVLESAALNRAAGKNWGQLVDAMGHCLQDMQLAVNAADTMEFRRLDAEFHRCLFNFCGNKMLVEAYDSIEFRVQTMRSRLSTSHEYNQILHREHQEILATLIARDTHRAGELLLDHIGRTESNYLGLLPVRLGNPTLSDFIAS